MNIMQATWQQFQRVLPSPWPKKGTPMAPAPESATPSPKLFGTARFPAINMAELDTLILDDEPDPLQALDRLLGSSSRYQVTEVRQPELCASAHAPQISLAQVLTPKDAGRKRSSCC